MAERMGDGIGLEGFSHAVALAVEVAEEIANNFIEINNFQELISSASEELKSLRVAPTAASLSLSTIITDRLARDWNEGNRMIIEEAGNLGIEPYGNFRGERLQAMSCLFQLLSSPV